MPIGEMINKQMGVLDPTSVLRQAEAARRFGVSPNALAQAMRQKGIFDQIERATFTDDDLINTYPAEMTEPMLRAAQRRINEDEEFARRYRAGTDYKPRKPKGINF